MPHARPDLRSTSAGVMLAFLAATYFLAYFDRMLMILVAEAVRNEFALTDKQLTLLTGASFTIIYGASGIVGGWLADRVNRIKILAWSLVAWSAFTTACGFANSFTQLALARAAVGVGEGANVPTAISLIGDRYPMEKRPLAVGLFYAGGNLAWFGVFLLGAWVAAEYGWRNVFYLAGPPGLVLAILIVLFVKEPARAGVDQIARGSPAARSSFDLVLSDRLLMVTITAGAIATFANLGVLQLLPSFFIRSHHLTPQQIGTYFGPALATGMVGGLLLGGWIGNRIAKYSLAALLYASAATIFAVIPLYGLLFTLRSLPLALVVTAIGTACSVLYSPIFTAAWQSMCHPRARGTAAGLASVLNAILGTATGSFLVGAVSDALKPQLGAESLRYALIYCLPILLLPTAMFVWAAAKRPVAAAAPTLA